MREIASGVFQWQAPHPDWHAGEGWDRLVSSYAIDDGDRLIVVDPLGFPTGLETVATERELIIVLTCPWHRRDSESLARRFGVTVHVPPPDPADPTPVAGEVYEAGDILPGGIEAHAGMEVNDLVLWLGERRMLIAGDSLIERRGRLEVPSEWIETATREEILEALRPLLDLPVTLVLPTHGDPMDGEALKQALR